MDNINKYNKERRVASQSKANEYPDLGSKENGDLLANGMKGRKKERYTKVMALIIVFLFCHS
jgi:hypothetical protein